MAPLTKPVLDTSPSSQSFLQSSNDSVGVFFDNLFYTTPIFI